MFVGRGRSRREFPGRWLVSSLGARLGEGKLVAQRLEDRQGARESRASKRNRQGRGDGKRRCEE
jgi:hypothetical protein